MVFPGELKPLKRKVAPMLSSVLSFLREVVPGGEPVAVAGALSEASDRLWGATLTLIWRVDEDSGQLQLRQISGAESQKAEGVVMVSSAGTREKVTEALTLGAKSFIVKPFEEDKVVEVIKAALGDGGF